MTDSAAQPARPWLPRWLRRTLRFLVYSLLALIALLVLAWTFRQQLLVPWLRPRLEVLIAGLLDARSVSIGTLDGDWLGNLDAKDLAVEGGALPLRAMRGVRIEARYSVWPLLHGDLAGLHVANVTAAEVQLDLRPAPSPAAAPAPVTPDTNLAHEPWRHWLAEGASVHVDRLHVLTSHGERQGPLALELLPGEGERELVAAYAGVRATVRTGPSGTALPQAQLQVSGDADDPGALLDLFGLGAGVRGGTLHADLELGLAPLWIKANLELSDLTHDTHRLSKSRLVVDLDRQRLAIDRASLDLPGVAVELREMTLPSPLATSALDLRELAGRFVVRIDDLGPYAELLPAPLRELLPIQGRLAGSAQRGLLHLDTAELTTQGAGLVIESGSLPLVSDDWRAAEGSVQFALSFAEFAKVLPWLGATSLSGRCTGNLTGSLAKPQVQVRLDLGACRSDRGGMAGAQGLVRGDATSLAIEGLRVAELRVPASGSEAPSNVALDASCGLREWTVDPDSLVVKLEVDSLLPAAVLAPFFAERGFGPAPTGSTSLQLQAHHDANGLAVELLRLRSAPDSPVEVAIDGSGIVPVHWPGNAFPTPLAAGAFSLHTIVRHPTAPANVPQIAFEGTLRLDAESTALDQLDLTVGPARLRGSLAVARGTTALFDPAAGVSNTPLQLALDLEQLELATLPAAWLGTTQLTGLVNARVRATGSLGEYAPEVLLTLADGSMRGEAVPTLTDANLRLELTTGDPATKALLLSAKATASLDPELGLDTAVDFNTSVRCDDRGTTLEPSVLRIGGGELTLALASNLRRADLIGGSIDASKTTLAGTVTLREFALEKVPPSLLSFGPVRGIVSGELAVDGTLGPPFGLALLHTGQLSLRDGELKIADMPRLEHLAAELRADQHTLTLHSLSGVLGAGRFTAKGSLQQPNTLLAESFHDAALDLRLDGEDLLLYRGDGAKVRAGIHATATGTLAAIALRGAVQLGRGTKYVRRISVLPALGSHSGTSVNEGLQLAPLPSAIGDRIDLDIDVTTRDAVEVRTHVVDGDIDVAAHLRGKGSAPRLEGTMSMRKGTLRFPGANLTVDSGLLTFTPSQPLFPELRVSATGKRMGVVITMSITGRYDGPQVQLTSVPALPPQDLIVLLTTGQLPSTLAERGATGQARFVGGYLAKEVFEKYFGSESTERGASLFDRLTIESGRDVSQNGTESLLIEYQLLPKLSVQVERDAYEDYNLGLLLRFRFR